MPVRTTQLAAGLVALAAGAARAQHVDPFAGSGCNCTAFGQGTCAINATGAANRTLFRMTPFGVLDLAEKNSADVPGDVSFVVSRRTAAYQCKIDPSGYGCNTMVQFQGDDPNSTDLVLQMQVEVDGNWGPYLYCNDVNASDPLGAWACTTTLDNSGSVPDYPAQCKADNFEPYGGACVVGFAKARENVTDLAECCALATQHDARYWTVDNSTKECSVYGSAVTFKHCANGTTGFYESPRETCNVSRVFDTVGLENITKAFGSHNRAYHVAGGLWFSHPHRGECKDGHYVGDGSGCTWRHVATTSAINASCMYDRVDAAVEAKDPTCFAQCPPNNRTTDCYNRCYAEASLQMTVAELTEPWTTAIGHGADACPQVDLSGVDAPAHMKPQNAKTPGARRGGKFVSGVW